MELNINIESHLTDLLRKGVAAYRVPQVIQERLEALTGTAP